MGKMIVLEKDNTWLQHREKLLEEAIELDRAIMAEDKVNMAEEAFDTIQVCIGILDKLSQEGINIQQAMLKHEKKLINRGWKIKKVIETKLVS